MLASGKWWWHGLIPSVGRDIQRWARRDVTISLKKLVAVNALSVKMKKMEDSLTLQLVCGVRGHC